MVGVVVARSGASEASEVARGLPESTASPIWRTKGVFFGGGVESGVGGTNGVVRGPSATTKRSAALVRKRL